MNCEFFVNGAIHAAAVEYNFHLFSRHSFIQSSELGAFAHQVSGAKGGVGGHVKATSILSCQCL